ncbi:hypothetical protein ACOP1L_14020, partial [Staphylococcus aureus]|nr:hypothetical protein [Staphylococcus aureus]
IIDANLDSVRSAVLADKEKSKYNEPLF